MGQLGVLLWKNFQFVKRHWVKTILFYALPLLFCSFLFLTLALLPIKNKPDCHFTELALPPSNPAFLLASLVCAEQKDCQNTGHHSPPWKLRELLNAEATEGGSRLCGGLTLNESKPLLGKRAMAACEERKDDATYDSLVPADLIFRGHLYFTPSTPATLAVMAKVEAYFDQILSITKISYGIASYANSLGPSFSDPKLSAVAGGLGELAASGRCYQPLANRTKAFANIQDAQEAAQKTDFATSGVWGIVEFIDTGSSSLKYKINTHFNLRQSLSTLYLQAAVEWALVEWKSGASVGVGLSTQYLPRRCQKDAAAYIPAYTSIAFVIGLGFIMVSYSVTSEICFEKSVGLLEFLFIAGVPRWKVKLSWFIFGFVFFASIALICALIFKGVSSKLIEHTSVALIIFVMVLFSTSLLCMCFLVSSLMGTAQKAAILIFVSQLAAYFLPSWLRIMPLIGYTGGRLVFVKLLAFLHTTVAAELTFAYILAWEGLNKGVDGSRLFDSPDPEDGFRGVGECIVYMLLQIPMYLGLSWYFDHTAPSKYGLKWPLWFPCMPSYWGCGRQGGGQEEEDKAALADVETPSRPKDVGIRLHNLTKSYGKGKTAVDNLTVDLYANEITAILGHNGAGKSTTMNVLTGMIEPTSGTGLININGESYSIWDHMADIRKSLGFCPQYDIIYPELTVVDHMLFYGRCKGIPDSEVKVYYEDVFEKMEMMHALKTPASKLSGGMKRKLSIAVALLGHPKVVILDEPTSAIDPFSRRAIWDLILQYRNKATVLISTHYMQEADVLGDRIAIIDKGALKTAGSPMYLKQKYGSGFKLILAHKTNIDAAALQDKLRVFTTLTLATSTATETVFSVPLQNARSVDMIGVFEYLEDHKEDIGISSFGISESTMEQVFFKIAEGGLVDNGDADAAERKAVFDKIQYKNTTGAPLLGLQILATWFKRFHLARKSFLVLVFQILAPLLFAVFILLFNKTIGGNDRLNGQAKTMHIWEYESSNLLFYSGPATSSIYTSLEADGFGTRCMAGAKLETKEGEALTCLGTSTPLPAPVPRNELGGACTCDVCPDGATDPAPSRGQVPSSDTVMLLSQRNATNFLIKDSKREDVFAGFMERSLTSAVPANVFETFGATIATASSTPANPMWKMLDDFFAAYPSNDILIVTGVERNNGRRPTDREEAMKDSSSTFLNALNNVILRSLVGAGDKRAFGVTLETEETSLNDEISSAAAITGILMGFFGALALLMPVFNVILVIVNENSSGNKTLQLLMGLHPLVYWGANFLWDALCFVLSLLIMLAFMAIFPKEFDIKLSAFFATGLVYGLSMILFSYVLSFVMNTARVTVLVVGMVAPFFSILALILLNFMEKSWYDVINTGLNFFPPYFLTDSLALVSFHDKIPEFIREPLMDWSNLGKRYVMVAIFAGIMVVLLLCFESGMMRAIKEGCWNCCCSLGGSAVGTELVVDQDPDVLSEEKRIEYPGSGDGDKDLLVVQKLRKAYGEKKVAVKGVSFGVHPGECFGLLGVNGAGKSSLFKCLAGYQAPTSGDAKIKRYSIFSESRKVARHMSYCPQEDVLYTNLTPMEHLAFYAMIRGIPSPFRGEAVQALVEATGLTPHAGKQSQALSGGNKRKLNFAISVLDFPSCIFLDEMTTGMDPKARRAAWECLQVRPSHSAISVLDFPSCIFLDEMTTGMDPKARRAAWECLQVRPSHSAIYVLDFPSCIFLDEMTTGMDPKARRAAWECLQVRPSQSAISVLDFPSCIFLDEMTTGMDPKARRATWECLQVRPSHSAISVLDFPSCIFLNEMTTGMDPKARRAAWECLQVRPSHSAISVVDFPSCIFLDKMTTGMDPKARRAAWECLQVRPSHSAISVLDFPSCIFLDEMTTGMDPKARRAAWECLQVRPSHSAISVLDFPSCIFLDEMTTGMDPKAHRAAWECLQVRPSHSAISVLDFPSCIFLDEMTTGMDPKARRAAWECLQVRPSHSAISVLDFPSCIFLDEMTTGMDPKAHRAAWECLQVRPSHSAISVLDFPSCIFLDEMTTGMDPKARRAAWECLQLAIERGCAVIITSHSMEECEALCNRLVIMVNGRFKCIGGVQYLKDRYGNSYNLKLRYDVATPPETLKDALQEELAGQNAKVVEEHPGYLEYEVGAGALRLSALFRLLHRLKEDLGVEEFSASQTTLEHVFVNMVKNQE